MAKIQLMKIRSIYGDIKGLLSQIPLAETARTVDEFIVLQFNQTLDNLSIATDTDFTKYKIPDNQRLDNWPEKFPSSIVRAQLGRVISRLEQEYGFDRETQRQSPGIVIVNKNENEISLQINYTIQDLISKLADEEAKNKLKQLDKELGKSDKEWNTIKNILNWILNFSKELFLEIIPIILQKKI